MGEIVLQTKTHSRMPLSILSYSKMAGLGHLWAWACAPALQGSAQRCEGLLEWVSRGRWEAWYKSTPCRALSRRT